jgi:Neuraminidase (sialidase)
MVNRTTIPSDIHYRISSDGGETWSEPEILQENDAGTNIHSANLARLTDGRIGITFVSDDEGFH